MAAEAEAVQNFSTANADEPINLSNDRKFALRVILIVESN